MVNNSLIERWDYMEDISSDGLWNSDFLDMLTKRK